MSAEIPRNFCGLFLWLYDIGKTHKDANDIRIQKMLAAFG